MAIRLASAVGQQRENVGILGDLDAIVANTGKGINDNLQAEREANKKAAEKEQAYKDAIALNLKVKPIEEATPEDRKEYEDYVTKGVSDIMIAKANPKVSGAELEKMQRVS